MKEDLWMPQMLPDLQSDLPVFLTLAGRFNGRTTKYSPPVNSERGQPFKVHGRRQNDIYKSVGLGSVEIIHGH